MSYPSPLILASQSPRRRQLLEQAGYAFQVVVPSKQAECGMCSGETPPELVARLAHQKAADVARRTGQGTIIGCDTVVECLGWILGKPSDEQHARQMLQLLRGRKHRVYSGLCVWRRLAARESAAATPASPDGKRVDDQVQVVVDVTRLIMDQVDDAVLEDYLATQQWEGKAGAFGYQDEIPWIRILQGSASNVIGLPLERLAAMLDANDASR